MSLGKEGREYLQPKVSRRHAKERLPPFRVNENELRHIRPLADLAAKQRREAWQKTVEDSQLALETVFTGSTASILAGRRWLQTSLLAFGYKIEDFTGTFAIFCPVIGQCIGPPLFGYCNINSC